MSIGKSVFAKVLMEILYAEKEVIIQKKAVFPKNIHQIMPQFIKKVFSKSGKSGIILLDVASVPCSCAGNTFLAPFDKVEQ